MAENEDLHGGPHRGAHPADRQIFAGSEWPQMQAAVGELSWLLTRRYAINSALKLVGDRHGLKARQRLAVGRAACSDEQKHGRMERMVEPENLRGKEVFVDGFNLLITMEAALGGGVLIHGRDPCLRDMSSVHGSYRSVQETGRALAIIGEGLACLGPQSVHWFLDQPVSNSGRLAQRIRETAAANGWPWTVELVFNPDGELAKTHGVVVSSDSVVLDRSICWAPLANFLVGRFVPEAWIVCLDGNAAA